MSWDHFPHRFRPGPWQYAYMLPWPLLIIVLGAFTFQAGYTAGPPPDWNTRMEWVFGEVGIGVVWAAWVLGMSVEVTDQHVTKRYLFGLLRETIPRDAMLYDLDIESGRGGKIERGQFWNANGPGYFGLYRGWCWRGEDVDQLRYLSQGRGDWGFDVHRQNRWLSTAIILVVIGGFLALLVAAWIANPGVS